MSNLFIQRSTALLSSAFASAGFCALLSHSWPIVRQAGAALAPPSRSPERLVEHTVVLAATATLTLVGGWLLASCVVCWLSVLRRGDGALDQSGWLRPQFVRALIAASLGALVASGSQAAAGARSDEAELPRALAGLTVPDRAYGGVRTHQVVAGESLWSVSEAMLPPGAPDRAVARTWPRLHHLNLDRVGNDPEVLHPGTNLRLPAWASVPTEGASR